MVRIIGQAGKKCYDANQLAFPVEREGVSVVAYGQVIHQIAARRRRDRMQEMENGNILSTGVGGAWNGSWCHDARDLMRRIMSNMVYCTKQRGTFTALPYASDIRSTCSVSTL